MTPGNCPECKGAGGRYVSAGVDAFGKPRTPIWAVCDTCEGRGSV